MHFPRFSSALLLCHRHHAPSRHPSPGPAAAEGADAAAGGGQPHFGVRPAAHDEGGLLSWQVTWCSRVHWASPVMGVRQARARRHAGLPAHCSCPAPPLLGRPSAATSCRTRARACCPACSRTWGTQRAWSTSFEVLVLRADHAVVWQQRGWRSWGHTAPCPTSKL